MIRHILAAVVRRASMAVHVRATEAVSNVVGFISAMTWGFAGTISGCGCEDDDAALCSIGGGLGEGAGPCKCECHKAIKKWDES